MMQRNLKNVLIPCLLLPVVLLAIGCGESPVPVQSSPSPIQTSPSPIQTSPSTPKPLSVTISPDSLLMKRGNNWSFTASVANSDNQSVNWSIQEGPTGGLVSDSGVYTAPTAMGVYHVIATSKADPSKSAAATVSVGMSGFTSASSLKIGRYAHTASLLANGKVYIAGGGIDSTTVDDGTDVIYSDEIFDPATDSFQPVEGLRRAFHTATVLQNGDVLFTGGISGETQQSITLSELLKAGSGTLQPTGSMSIARYYHTATRLQDGRVLVTGGYDAQGAATKTAEIYVPASGTFTRVGDMGTPRAGHFATLLANGKVLITGGLGDKYLSSVELFDPATDSFSLAGTTASPTIGGTTLLADGRVLISGEMNSDFSGPGPSELYDPVTGRFTRTGTMAAWRYSYTATLLPDGTVLLAGGYIKGPGATPGTGYTQVIVADTEIYDPSTGAFDRGPTMRQAQHMHTATLLPDGSVLLVGGRGPDYAPTASAEIYQ